MMMDPAWRAVTGGRPAYEKTQDDWARTLMLEHRSGVPAPLLDSMSGVMNAARTRVAMTDDYKTFSGLDPKTVQWLSAHEDNMKIARDDAEALDGVTGALRELDSVLNAEPANALLAEYARAISPERPADIVLDIRGGFSDAFESRAHANMFTARSGELFPFEIINFIEAYVRAEMETPPMPKIPARPSTFSGNVPRVPGIEKPISDEDAKALAEWKPAKMDFEKSTAVSGFIKDWLREMPEYHGIQSGYNLAMSGLSSVIRRASIDDRWEGGWDTDADLLGSLTEQRRAVARKAAGFWYAAAKKADPGPYILPPDGTWSRKGHELLRAAPYTGMAVAEFVLTAAATKKILGPSLAAVDKFTDAAAAAQYAVDASKFAEAAAFAYGSWNGINKEAAGQAGAVFERGIEAGMTYEEARAAEVSAYWMNVAVLSVSDPLQNALAFGFVNPFGRFLGKSRAARTAVWAMNSGVSGLFEGGEEWGQAEIDNTVLGLPRDERQMWKEFGIGFAMGTLHTSVGTGVRGIANERARINKSRELSDRLEKLLRAAEATKTAARIPEALGDFVEQASEGKIEDLWIDGEVLYGFAQSAGVKSEEELADVLGVEDDYRAEFIEMLKAGSDVRTKGSALISKIAAEPEKYAEIRRHLKFNPGDMSAAEAEIAERDFNPVEKAYIADTRALHERTLALGERFADFMDDAKEQLRAAARPDLFGMNGKNAEMYLTLYLTGMVRKAERMGVPVEELVKPGAFQVIRDAAGGVKIRIDRGMGAGQSGGAVVLEEHPAYAQAMYRNPAKDIIEFRNNVVSGKSGKSYFEFTAPSGTTVEIAYSNVKHFHGANEQALSDAELKALTDNIENIQEYAYTEGTTGKYGGQLVLTKIDTPEGKFGVVFEYQPSGRVFVISAFKSTYKGIDAWMKKEGAHASSASKTFKQGQITLSASQPSIEEGRTPRALETEKSATAISTGRPLSVESIQQELGIVKQSENETFYQGAGEKTRAADTDAKYFAAIEAGDMETAQKIVDSQARKKGYISGGEYRMNHRAPNSRDEDVTTRLDLAVESGIVPPDYWTKPRIYLSDSREFESHRIILNTLNLGKDTIKMYRAVPKNVKEAGFRNGDWITPSREYAKAEGELITGGYRIIENEVNVRDVWWDGNSISEFGYDDGSEYAYRNTKNNRKLTDAIARDENGSIVPPSARFNAGRPETYYQMGAGARAIIADINTGTFDPANPNIYYQSDGTNWSGLTGLVSLEENIRSGSEGMDRVISDHVGAENAMWREGIDGISFIWGKPGKGKTFKGGYGVSHIIAKRNAAGQDGPAIARKMVEVIANGTISDPYQEHDRTKINIDHGGYRAVLTQTVNGNKRTWLTTGFFLENENSESDAASGEYGPVVPGATLSESTRPNVEEVADSELNDSLPSPEEIFKQLETQNGEETER
ncbi:MAG: hypothetical protein LBG12_12995, partial [Synergistaceae bacterium]|nr:hypothetical protein [Synergistaceae bacterium]